MRRDDDAPESSLKTLEEVIDRAHRPVRYADHGHRESHADRENDRTWDPSRARSAGAANGSQSAKVSSVQSGGRNHGAHGILLLRWRGHGHSEGGVFVVTPEIKPIGSIVMLEIKLLDRNVSVSTQGIVRWIRDASTSEGAPLGMGVQFFAMSDETLRAVRDCLVDRPASALAVDK